MAKTKTSNTNRVRKLSRRHKKKVVKGAHRPPNSFKLFKLAVTHLWRYKRLFGGILLVYFLLYFLIVKGLAPDFTVSEVRSLLREDLEVEISGPAMAAGLFGTLLGTAGSVSGEAASVYQMMLFVFFSLVIIRGLRQTFESSSKVGLKSAFYQSSYPLVPYLLVVMVIILQLIPALVGLSIYSIVASNGIIVSSLEQIIWTLVTILGVGISVYFVSASLFASYIVTLPDMTPLRALRSAKRLVKFQRWSIIRKVLFLPFILLILLAVLFLPLAFYLPVVAEIIFLIVTLLIVILTHTYFYVLYREML